MNGHALWLPIAITIFAWWFSTGLILLLVRLPRQWHHYLLAGFAVLAGIGVWGLVASARTSTWPSIYCGFVCTLLIWGWHEASFLMGVITGPRPVACPQGIAGWRRFPYATATLIYHEVALFLTLIAIGAMTWQSPNQISFWTFGLLFVMRLSAKFNIFMGVPNLTEAFFPPHLEHLKSYLPKRPMNVLMPISLLASAILATGLWQAVSSAAQSGSTPTALLIVLTLTCLGMLEHVFMITPLPDAALWHWAVQVPVTPKADTITPVVNPVGDLKKHDNA
jgi:putative photosynthetic complex assembly protein 2